VEGMQSSFTDSLLPSKRKAELRCPSQLHLLQPVPQKVRI
jgi:hypothetical protein